MRVWDINPGYLNRQSLLGEHRELHGIVSILRHNKKGYSNHPETRRWVGHGWALKQRHQLLVAEMGLRGYVDRSPVLLRLNLGVWPEHYIDPPGDQITILKKKYRIREHGRIPLPKNVQQLWAQHKYSVMARDIGAFKAIGRRVASKASSKAMDRLALEVAEILQSPPEPRLVENTLFHLWDYVSEYASITGKELNSLSMRALFNKVQQLSCLNNVTFLIESTVISELDAWKM